MFVKVVVHGFPVSVWKGPCFSCLFLIKDSANLGSLLTLPNSLSAGDVC